MKTNATSIATDPTIIEQSNPIHLTIHNIPTVTAQNLPSSKPQDIPQVQPQENSASLISTAEEYPPQSDVTKISLINHLKRELVSGKHMHFNDFPERQLIIYFQCLSLTN